MGRTYEALERAAQESETRELPTREVPTRDVPKGSGPAAEQTSGRARHLPQEGVATRYLEIKTRLMNRFPDQSIKTILVTAISGGDGATTSAVNLATALTQDRRLKVLLIDACLQQPHLHKIFNVPAGRELASLLRNERVSLSDLRAAGRENLHVVAGPGSYDEALTLFESRPFERFFKGVRSKFDYVVLDAPPVTRSPETQVLGPKADGVILVLRSGKTRRQVARRAKSEMEAGGAKIVGAILNRRKLYIPGWIYRRL